MRPAISEFSYGYAITDELIHWHGFPLTAAPVLPSLYVEGQPGGGYDLRLDRPGVPLFLQFKLSHCMKSGKAREAREGVLITPYYRMHIPSRRHSRQHEMLLDLEAAGNEVYYSAPAFHEPNELNEAYLTHVVKARSVWIRPSWVGPLPDEDDHYVAFLHPGPSLFRSEPKSMRQPLDFDSFSDRTLIAIRQRGQTALLSENLEALTQQLVEIVRDTRDVRSELSSMARDRLANLEPIRRIAFYAHAFLATQSFVVHEEEI